MELSASLQEIPTLEILELYFRYKSRLTLLEIIKSKKRDSFT